MPWPQQAKCRVRPVCFEGQIARASGLRRTANALINWLSDPGCAQWCGHQAASLRSCAWANTSGLMRVMSALPKIVANGRSAASSPHPMRFTLPGGAIRVESNRTHPASQPGLEQRMKIRRWGVPHHMPDHEARRNVQGSAQSNRDMRLVAACAGEGRQHIACGALWNRRANFIPHVLVDPVANARDPRIAGVKGADPAYGIRKDQFRLHVAAPTDEGQHVERQRGRIVFCTPVPTPRYAQGAADAEPRYGRRTRGLAQ